MHSFWFLSQDYVYAWPMVAITYVIVRKDLPSFMPDPASQSLLVAFFKALYDPEFISKCQEDYLFLPVPEGLRDGALESLDMLVVSTDAPTWIIEDDVLDDGLGAGDFVISARRSLASSVDLVVLAEKVADAVESLIALTGDMKTLQQQSASLEEELVEWSSQLSTIDEKGGAEEVEKRADAGFIMAIVSLALWLVSICVIVRQKNALSRLEEEVRKSRMEQSRSSGRRRRGSGDGANRQADEAAE
jgi:hypothetical protein